MLEHGIAPATGVAYEIDNSIRINDNDSAYLAHTPSGSSNLKTWTLSLWFKRANLSTRQVFFGVKNATNGHSLEMYSNDTIYIYETGSGSTVLVNPSMKFRDTSSWYHLVLAVDTTQATASNRVKYYVNGELLTDFITATYPAQNADLTINTQREHRFGVRPDGSFYSDVYFSEINFESPIS